MNLPEGFFDLPVPEQHRILDEIEKAQIEREREDERRQDEVNQG